MVILTFEMVEDKHYGMEGPGIESRWGEIFRTRPDRP